MIDRIMRAVQLDRKLYREVAEDETLTAEAFVIVLLASVLSALGGAAGQDAPMVKFFGHIANGIILGWVVWAVVAYVVGSMLGGRSSVSELLRALGYANAPRFVALLGFIPCVGWMFVVAAALLSLAAGVIAIREGMEFDTTKALITAAVGFILYVVVTMLLGAFTASLLVVPKILMGQ